MRLRSLFRRPPPPPPPPRSFNLVRGRVEEAEYLLRQARDELWLAESILRDNGLHYCAENKRKVADRIYRFLRPPWEEAG